MLEAERADACRQNLWYRYFELVASVSDGIYQCVIEFNLDHRVENRREEVDNSEAGFSIGRRPE
jgi:hypothetical protein